MKLRIERRNVPAQLDEAKFSTQRFVTYILLLIFTAVTTKVFLGDDQAERSTILQTVINFTMLAIGFWLGASKGEKDGTDALTKIASVPPTPAVFAPAPVPAPITADDVSVVAQGDVTVNAEKKP